MGQQVAQLHDRYMMMMMMIFIYLQYTEVWYRNPRERDNSEDLDVDGRKVLKLILEKWVGAWTGLIWLTIGISKGFV